MIKAKSVDRLKRDMMAISHNADTQANCAHVLMLPNAIVGYIYIINVHTPHIFLLVLFIAISLEFFILFFFVRSIHSSLFVI